MAVDTPWGVSRRDLYIVVTWRVMLLTEPSKRPRRAPTTRRILCECSARFARRLASTAVRTSTSARRCRHLFAVPPREMRYPLRDQPGALTTDVLVVVRHAHRGLDRLAALVADQDHQAVRGPCRLVAPKIDGPRCMRTRRRPIRLVASASPRLTIATTARASEHFGQNAVATTARSRIQ